MKEQDFSREIFEKYYNSNGRILKISLRDQTELEGLLVGFYHGDEDEDEPFIYKWDFIDKNNITDLEKILPLSFDDQKAERIIFQKDIESVTFIDFQ